MSHEPTPAVEPIPAETRLGEVHLTVAELERSIRFYERAVGLGVQEREGARAVLGVSDRELLVLHEEAGARPAHGYTGLFHVALLLPERIDLARWLVHAARERIPLAGLSDHFVSEAVYLSDPDEHGIEIYWDHPREIWEGRVAQRMTTLPLDTTELLGTLGDSVPEPFSGLPIGTVMGHVHLRVATIPETVAFYRDVLGFAQMATLGSQAAFFGAGGYHHHIGANTWQSADAKPAPAGMARLRKATIVVPDGAAHNRLVEQAAEADHSPQTTATGTLIRDPSGNPIELRVG